MGPPILEGPNGSSFMCSSCQSTRSASTSNSGMPSITSPEGKPQLEEQVAFLVSLGDLMNKHKVSAEYFPVLRQHISFDNLDLFWLWFKVEEPYRLSIVQDFVEKNPVKDNVGKNPL
ncbi:uncharacterized protein LOC132636383 [Lycium barbarum]|uniref:uncharacterized protein LOC132636383 n=1 Tax=Lycium barbarum TaxID=112863 RepID=UPI00293E1098|nr:uncharacterized protein LOC132636383 [Lycium barbarum]